MPIVFLTFQNYSFFLQVGGWNAGGLVSVFILTDCSVIVRIFFYVYICLLTKISKNFLYFRERARLGRKNGEEGAA
jgi:hypothetical protein